MARRVRTAICARCGRKFVVCRFNGHHQQYCRDPDCVAERRRERQRAYYRKKYRADAGFREAEQVRCREGARRRRQEKDAAVSADEGDLALVDLALVTAGLVSQLIDSRDPSAVAASTRGLERRGRELSVSGGPARASPVS